MGGSAGSRSTVAPGGAPPQISPPPGAAPPRVSPAPGTAPPQMTPPPGRMGPLSERLGHLPAADPQGIGQNINWEDIMARYRQSGKPGLGGRASQGNPWSGGLAAMRDRFTQGNPREAITNPGSVAASQGAQTSSGITAPGAVTGAPASPTGADPHAPQNAYQPGTAGTDRRGHAQQLIQALRARQ